MGKGGKGKKGGKQDSAGIEPSAVEHAQLSSREKEKTERRTVSLSEAKRLIAAAQARVQGKTSLLDSNLERMQALFKEMQRVRKNPKDLEEKFLELEGELKTIEDEEIRLENEASTIVRPDQSVTADVDDADSDTPDEPVADKPDIVDIVLPPAPPAQTAPPAPAATVAAPSDRREPDATLPVARVDSAPGAEPVAPVVDVLAETKKSLSDIVGPDAAGRLTGKIERELHPDLQPEALARLTALIGTARGGNVEENLQAHGLRAGDGSINMARVDGLVEEAVSLLVRNTASAPVVEPELRVDDTDIIESSRTSPPATPEDEDEAHEPPVAAAAPAPTTPHEAPHTEDAHHDEHAHEEEHVAHAAHDTHAADHHDEPDHHGAHGAHEEHDTYNEDEDHLEHHDHDEHDAHDVHDHAHASPRPEASPVPPAAVVRRGPIDTRAETGVAQENYIEIIECLGESKLQEFLSVCLDLSKGEAERLHAAATLFDGLDESMMRRLEERVLRNKQFTDWNDFIQQWKNDLARTLVESMGYGIRLYEDSELAKDPDFQELEGKNDSFWEKLGRGVKKAAPGIAVGALGAVAFGPTVGPAAGAASGLLTMRVFHAFGFRRKEEKLREQKATRIREQTKTTMMARASTLVGIYINRTLDGSESLLRDRNVMTSDVEFESVHVLSLHDFAAGAALEAATPAERERATADKADALRAELAMRNRISEDELPIEFEQISQWRIWANEVEESFKDGKLSELWERDPVWQKRALGHAIACSAAAVVGKFIGLVGGTSMERFAARGALGGVSGGAKGLMKDREYTNPESPAAQVDKLAIVLEKSNEELGAMVQAEIQSHTAEVLTNADRLGNALVTGGKQAAVVATLGFGFDKFRELVVPHVTEYVDKFFKFFHDRAQMSASAPAVAEGTEMSGRRGRRIIPLAPGELPPVRYNSAYSGEIPDPEREYVRPTMPQAETPTIEHAVPEVTPEKIPVPHFFYTDSHGLVLEPRMTSGGKEVLVPMSYGYPAPERLDAYDRAGKYLGTWGDKGEFFPATPEQAAAHGNVNIVDTSLDAKLDPTKVRIADDDWKTISDIIEAKYSTDEGTAMRNLEHVLEQRSKHYGSGSYADMVAYIKHLDEIADYFQPSDEHPLQPPLPDLNHSYVRQQLAEISHSHKEGIRLLREGLIRGDEPEVIVTELAKKHVFGFDPNDKDAQNFWGFLLDTIKKKNLSGVPITQADLISNSTSLKTKLENFEAEFWARKLDDWRQKLLTMTPEPPQAPVPPKP